MYNHQIITTQCDAIMFLTEDNNDAAYQIKAISPGKININGKTYTNSLIISREKLITHWNPSSIDTLTEDDLLLLLTLKPDIILIGTGEKSIIIPAKKLSCLIEKNFHVECMNTKAACHTYTILSAEGRNVVAGIIL